MSNIHGYKSQILHDTAAIEKRVATLGKQISIDYRDEELLVIGVLKGAVVFMTDLIRAIDLPLQIDFIGAQSYEGTQSTGQVRITHDLTTEIKGRNVLLVEDIIDTGQTVDYLLKTLQVRQPKSIKTCALLSKPSARKVPHTVNYCGFEISKEFVIGYGLDLDGHYRNLPYIVQILKD